MEEGKRRVGATSSCGNGSLEMEDRPGLLLNYFGGMLDCSFRKSKYVGNYWMESRMHPLQNNAQ